MLIKTSRRLELLARRHQPFQLAGGLAVIGNHLLRELLFIGIALPLRDLRGLDFEHIAPRRFLDEVFGLRCNPECGIHAETQPAVLDDKERPACEPVQ